MVGRFFPHSLISSIKNEVEIFVQHLEWSYIVNIFERFSVTIIFAGISTTPERNQGDWLSYIPNYSVNSPSYNGRHKVSLLNFFSLDFIIPFQKITLCSEYSAYPFIHLFHTEGINFFAERSYIRPRCWTAIEHCWDEKWFIFQHWIGGRFSRIHEIFIIRHNF